MSEKKGGKGKVHLQAGPALETAMTTGRARLGSKFQSNWRQAAASGHPELRDGRWRNEGDTGHNTTRRTEGRHSRCNNNRQSCMQLHGEPGPSAQCPSCPHHITPARRMGDASAAVPVPNRTPVT